MKTGWTTNSSNGAIWLALSPCHMTMTCKINKLEKPSGQLRIFPTLFGRSATFYAHFRADNVTSEWSTRISTSVLCSKNFHGEIWLSQGQLWCTTLTGRHLAYSVLFTALYFIWTKGAWESWNEVVSQSMANDIIRFKPRTFGSGVEAMS